MHAAPTHPGEASVQRAGRPRMPRRRPIRPASPAVGVRPVRFVHLSFEGPDRYASAGGLGVRVANLARALVPVADAVDLYFVGDPDAPGVERRDGVVLHRWCQAISAGARDGVYDAEEDKIEDLCRWWPRHLADVVAADRRAGRTTVVLAEDWHTAWPLIALHDELTARGLRDAAVLAWTANNRFGFERLDFGRLAGAATLVTISRAMKHLMWGFGVNPLVVPNGIPDDLLAPVPGVVPGAIGRALGGRRALAKVGRWDPDKRWAMAVDTIARLSDRGEDAVLVARGWNGSAAASAHADELRARAAHHGLPWHVCTAAGPGPDGLVAAIAAAAPHGAGVLELAFPVAGAALHALYVGADAVLANSGFEPFGLVGLEAMAARAVVVTGSTGEDYLAPYRNGFALDTDDPGEIVRALDWLAAGPGRDATLRAAAHATAATYRWADVVERLVLALGLDAR